MVFSKIPTSHYASIKYPRIQRTCKKNAYDTFLERNTSNLLLPLSWRPLLIRGQGGSRRSGRPGEGGRKAKQQCGGRPQARTEQGPLITRLLKGPSLPTHCRCSSIHDMRSTALPMLPRLSHTGCVCLSSGRRWMERGGKRGTHSSRKYFMAILPIWQWFCGYFLRNPRVAEHFIKVHWITGKIAKISLVEPPRGCFF